MISTLLRAPSTVHNGLKRSKPSWAAVWVQGQVLELTPTQHSVCAGHLGVAASWGACWPPATGAGMDWEGVVTSPKKALEFWKGCLRSQDRMPSSGAFELERAVGFVWTAEGAGVPVCPVGSPGALPELLPRGCPVYGSSHLPVTVFSQFVISPSPLASDLKSLPPAAGPCGYAREENP